MTISPLRIGAVLFEGFELLDFYGPLEMFGLLGDGAQITVVAMQPGAIRSSGGPSGVADKALGDCQGFDVLLVPGGIGTRSLVHDGVFLAELKRLAEASRMVATVCTGSFLLAATGLLDGRQATSNKRVFEFVKQRRPSVQWIAKARWVEDERYFTSSGISAGIDMTLALIARMLGRERSLEIAAQAEYTWQEDPHCDPFAAENGCE